ncbi:3',5'-cyclic-nucleotide phosphodiesterase [Gnomoniopsis smithogilvyi]|uniref:Phosphodiesterase n=1 Tax=Gnomoniopsis smithogilvyi TaxID=1191159 RepID=A0A9W9CXQ5_9PEZI|nr:3',5'-cyclic-nucleotide phosphodiesterase [Gnomoniopsis smithogilvyi]
MARSSLNVIYVDRLAHEQPRVPTSDLIDGVANRSPTGAEPEHLTESLRILREAFGDIHICSSSSSCLSTLSALHHASTIDHTPTIVLIDVPYDERLPQRRGRSPSRSRSPSPHSNPSPAKSEAQISAAELYGLRLLQRVVAEADMLKLTKLVIPIPIISLPPLLQVGPRIGSTEADENAVGGTPIPMSSPSGRSSRPELVQTCVDYGAADVMTSPLQAQNIESLEVHAYKAHQASIKERDALLQARKNRKRSWVGVDTGGKPFAYLREAMVAGLMRGICRLDDDEENSLGSFRISISSERQAQIAEAVGRWQFCAHDFSDDELVVAASLMFSHALSMPELEQWRIPPDQLTQFVIACRAAYNSFVPYHNFRHVVDVLQATFSFLLHTDTIHPYAFGDQPQNPSRSPVEALLAPFEALTLLITAIGHDVGHPGVNNGFLVTLNAPLAQLYNDRSVLESFHCAAFSQILRRYWPSAFEDRKMRSLMISSILATDMGLHFDYMKRLADLKEKLAANDSIDGWNSRMVEEQKGLACALLIKCADISNVARRHETALQWMDILAEEFARQRSMEKELEIPTSLMAPLLTERTSQFRSQLNFMSMFALPLFQGVADLLPNMQYTVDELTTNFELFQFKIAQALNKPQLEKQTQPVVNQSAAQNATLSPQAPEAIPRSASTPELRGGFRSTNGISSHFEPVKELATGDDCLVGREKQRNSETTEGSSFAHANGDCASSATTGRMPLSPSTQGTSVVSQESLERPRSNPIPTISAPDSAKSMTEPKMNDQPIFEVETASSVNSANSAIERSIKKRPSRFRMNAFQFFRRHKSPGPASTATESP